MRLFYHPFQPPAGDPLPTEGQGEPFDPELQSSLLHAIAPELHVLSEPLERRIEGRPATFYRCSCGWIFEATGIVGPLCPMETAYQDFLRDIDLARAQYLGTVARKRAVLDLDRRLLREGR